MSISGREVLERFYTAERQSLEPAGMLEHCTGDIKLIQSGDLPYGGVWEGHKGFTDCFTKMNELFDKIDVKPHTILESGDTVVVLSDCTYRIRRTQDEFTKPLSQTVIVDRKQEKIIQMQPFYWDVADFNRRFNA